MANQSDNTLSEKQALAVAMLASGEKGTQIAETLGVTVQTVSSWRRKPYFNAAINRELKIKLEKIRNSSITKSENALNKLDALLGSKSEKIQIDAAKLLLTVGGYLNAASANADIQKIGACTSVGIERELAEQKEKDDLGFSLGIAQFATKEGFQI